MEKKVYGWMRYFEHKYEVVGYLAEVYDHADQRVKPLPPPEQRPEQEGVCAIM